jgi:hypothetical protein
VPAQVEPHTRRCYIAQVARGCGSVGRASPCQGEGRGFESRHPLWCEVRGCCPRQRVSALRELPGGRFCRRAAGTAVWPSGSGKGLQNPVPRFNSGHRLDPTRGEVAARAIASRSPRSLDSVCSGARSSAGERCLHTAEVTGSIPVAPTGYRRRWDRVRGPGLLLSSPGARSSGSIRAAIANQRHEREPLGNARRRQRGTETTRACRG